MHNNSRRTNKGFSLVELLIVIAIVAILATIILSVIVRKQNAADLAKCMSNLKQCGAASLMYCDDNDGRFAPARITDSSGKVIRDWAEGQCVGGRAGRFVKDGVLADSYTPEEYRPLNKYVKSIECFHCSAEACQMLPGDYKGLAWDRFGDSYLMNVTFAYPTKEALFYTLNRHVGPNQFTGIKSTEVPRPKLMIMIGERSLHYWYGVPCSAIDPKPADDPPIRGHSGRRPWVPVVFCDGHVDYIYMTPGLSGKNWEIAPVQWLGEH